MFKSFTTLLFCFFIFSLSNITTSNVEFRYLMIIKTKLIDPGRIGTIEIPKHRMESIKQAFTQTFPQMVQFHTQGKVKLTNSVVVSSTPLTLSRRRPGWPDMPMPEDLEEDLRLYNNRKGVYDNIFIYYPCTPGHASCQALWACVGDCNPSISNQGWASLIDTENLTIRGWALPGWWHEALHYTGDYWYPKVRNVPVVAQVHDAEKYGYRIDQEGHSYWQAYYRDYVLGRLRNNHGLGDKAYSKGIPRNFQTFKNSNFTFLNLDILKNFEIKN